MDSDGYHAPNASDGQRHEKGSFHHGRRMFRRGLLDGPLLMEQGGVLTHTWPYYFSGISVPQKISGRPPIYPSELIREGIKNIPLCKRQTQRKLAALLGVSKTTVQRWIVDSTIQVHCNSLNPVLMEENKVAQLIMALEAHDPQDPMKFLRMMDCIHIDEKWFFLSQQRERYLLLPEEKNPKWCIKSKLHITKVMFLCAIARPRFNPSVNSWWDGKLGIWPIGDWEPAKRASKN